MKILKNIPFLALALWSVFACQKEEVELMPNNSAPALAKSTGSSYTFQNGVLGTPIVPVADLQDLGGGLSGDPIVVSNNPEVVVRTGWLFKPPVDGAGNRIPMSGKFDLYLYHDNRSGQNLYLHVFVTNPNSHSVTVSAKGNIYNRNQYDGKTTNGQKRGFGPSYQVASDWMSSSFSTVKNPTTITNTGGWTSLAVAYLPNRNTMDGLLSIDASAGCFVYVVASTSPNPATAVNLSQANVHATGQYWNSASQSYEPTFKPETGGTFGRECGIYQHSGWSGNTALDLPNNAAHLGLALNTTSKFALPSGQFLQNQNAPAIAVINNSSSYTYGNYGHYYDFTLSLNNHAGRQRHVRVWLGTNQAGSNAASFFFHAPVRIAGTTKEVFNTGSSPRTLLYDVKYSWGTLNVPIQFYVPGLISAGQQIVVEVLN